MRIPVGVGGKSLAVIKRDAPLIERVREPGVLEKFRWYCANCAALSAGAPCRFTARRKPGSD